MPRANLFLDSSALFAGVASPLGAARALLQLAEANLITITVSEQVITETERAGARKIPTALSSYRQALRYIGLQIQHDPSQEEAQAYQHIISHQADVPIIVAAIKAQVDYLVTLNRRHFDDPQVSARSGLRIGTPGDALAWVREQLASA
jgi:predicted nucleic acid-binding protein